jgi:hypothetical protein
MPLPHPANNSDAKRFPDPAKELFRTCGVCAHKSLAEEKFCGMCGAALQSTTDARSAKVAKAVPISAARWSDSEPSRGGNFPEYASDAELRSTRAVQDQRESPWTRPERILPSFDVQPDHYEPSPYRYRLYAGVAVAMLLAVLVYMSSRGTKTISSTATTESPAAITIPPEPAQAPAGSAQNGSDGSASAEETSPASQVQNENPPAATGRKNKPAGRSPASLIARAESSTSAFAADASGAQDLATAESYLNGTLGMPRDRREAAQWLWKAVGKGNLAATTTLSDLYLRGDGVPKSCDQARLLLDAAARKGGKPAAERLRHLQAFGCE